LFGLLSPNVLGQIAFQPIYNSAGVGVKSGFLLEKISSLGDCGNLLGYLEEPQ
jgi:hypothetical protein